MKTLGLLSILLVVLVVGGFIFIASTDVPVEQVAITRDIPTTDLK